MKSIVRLKLGESGRVSARPIRSTPVATYRVQLSQAFTFRDLEALTPYLRDLGVTADPETLERVRSGGSDLLEAARATSIEYLEGEFAVRAVLAG